MTQPNKDQTNFPSGLPPRIWSATPALEQIWRLNEHFLNVVAEVVKGRRGHAAFTLPHREMWLAMDSKACEVAACHSILLMEADFHNEHTWRAVVQGRRISRPDANECLPTRRARELLREILVVVWPLAREDRVAARVLFGMADEVASLVATLNAQQIDRIAERYRILVRPRWESRLLFWGNLLRSAQAHELQGLRKVHAHGFQLLGGDLLPAGA